MNYLLSFFILAIIAAYLITDWFVLDQSNIQQESIHGGVTPLNLKKNDDEGASESFQDELLKAIKDLKTEIDIEKKSIDGVVHEVQDVIHSMDVQKQKLQEFIEEMRIQFNLEKSEERAERGG